MIFEVLESIPSSSSTAIPTGTTGAPAPPLQQMEGDFLEVTGSLVQVKSADGKVIGVICLTANTMIRMQVK